MLEKAYSCIAIVNVNTGSYSENDPFVWQKNCSPSTKLYDTCFGRWKFFFGKYTTDRARQLQWKWQTTVKRKISTYKQIVHAKTKKQENIHRQKLASINDDWLLYIFSLHSDRIAHCITLIWLYK